MRWVPSEQTVVSRLLQLRGGTTGPRWNFSELSCSPFSSRFSFQISLFDILSSPQAIFFPSLALWKHLIIFLISAAALLYYRVSSVMAQQSYLKINTIWLNTIRFGVFFHSLMFLQSRQPPPFDLPQLSPHWYMYIVYQQRCLKIICNTNILYLCNQSLIAAF